MNIQFNGNYCSCFIDKSSSNGILHFTNEIDVTFVLRDGEWIFDSAWQIGVCERTWENTDKEDFEESYPGLIDEMLINIRKKEDLKND